MPEGRLTMGRRLPTCPTTKPRLTKVINMLHFREELEDLKSKLLEMGGMVESAIHNSVYALVERDEALAKEVMWKEAQINQREMEIDDLATRMLALFQPMARDLRFIT